MRITFIVMDPSMTNEGAAPGKVAQILKKRVSIAPIRRHDTRVEVDQMAMTSGSEVVRDAVRVMAGRTGSASGQMSAAPALARNGILLETVIS